MKNYLQTKLSLFLIIFLTTFLSSCSSDDDTVDPIVEDELVIFADAEVEAAVLASLGLNSSEQLTTSAVENLTTLNLDESSVTSLSGLDKATNLVEFSAEQTNIEDFTPIENLTSIKKVVLENAAIPNNSVAFLANMNQLEYLNLRGTLVSDISVLSNKSNLKHLSLRQSLVSDISPLANLTQMQYLNLNRSASDQGGIEDVSYVENMHDLYYLSLRNSFIGDEQFQMFENFTKLVESNIRDTGITDITPLVAIFEAGGFLDGTPFDNKVSLDLQGNNIQNPCVIEPWVNQFEPGELEGWNGASCQDFEDPEVFEDAALEALVRSILEVDNDTELTTELLASVDELDARGSGVENITGVGLMPNITYMRLDDTNVTDLGPVIDLENLTYFNINSVDGITDISPLANNTNLEVLIARNIPFGNDGMQTLLNFPNLWRINMRNTGVTDLSILADMMQNGALQDAANPNGVAKVDVRELNADFCVIFPYINNIGDLSGGSFDDCE